MVEGIAELQKTVIFFGIACISPVSRLCVFVAWILKYQISVISNLINVNRKTTRKLINEFRKILIGWLIENISKIGDLKKKKGIYRRTKERFLNVVDKRDANILK